MAHYRTSLVIPAHIADRLKALAEIEHRSINRQMLVILEKFLEDVDAEECEGVR